MHIVFYVLGSSGPYVFTVSIGGQSVRSVDTYSYITAPTVNAASGCSTLVGSTTTTSDCPTNGLNGAAPVRITITGTDFGNSNASATVDLQPCLNVVHTNATHLVCDLPVGNGAQKLVVVTSSQGWSSAGVPLISYAFPNVTSVQYSGVSPAVDLPRSGTVYLTIIGSNFGVDRASALIGTRRCINPWNNHTSLICTLPEVNPVAGSLNLPVILLQSSGVPSSGSSGSLSYQQCLPGTRVDMAGHLCIGCEAGRFSSTYDATACVDCSIGTYSNQENSFCSRCAFGYYSNTLGVSTCTACDPGYYQPSLGSSACISCQAGRYSVSSGATSCVFCPGGTFSDFPGRSYCITCHVGRVQPIVGQTACESCYIGFFQSSNNFLSCEASAPGYYVGFAGATGSVACPIGTFCDQLSCTTCLDCSVGRYAGVTSLTACLECGMGRFSLVGQSICRDCLPGQFSPYTGASTCTICSAGFFSNSTAAEKCEACPKGTRQHADFTRCDNCTVGTISSSLGSTVCANCIPGKYSNTEQSDICARCEPGSFSSNIASISCQFCSPGRYAAAQGSSVCVDCSAGFFSNSTASTACTSCIAGSFAISGATRCELCLIGKISYSGQSYCTDCQPGSFVSAAGASSCTLCEPGQQATASGSSACSNCTSGTFAFQSGQSICDYCAIGTYQPESGRVECIDASEGSFTNFTGAIEPFACEPGWYQSQIKQSVCLACPAGWFSNISAASVCENCQAGFFQNLAYQTACKICEPGTYQNSESSESCINCEPGEYSSIAGSTSCSFCEPGRYTAEPRSETCAICQAGFYQNVERKTECSVCVAGEYAPGVGATLCVQCSAGKFSLLEASIMCLDCEVGKFKSSAGGGDCAACEAGKFMDIVASTDSDCRDCPSGKFSNTVGGASVCGICDKGFFATSQSSSVCEKCDAGRYTPSANEEQDGFEYCEYCPEGQYVSNSSGSMCDLCEPGKFAAPMQGGSVGKSSCDVCEAGTYQSQPGSSSCITCESGTVTISVGSPQCEQCSPGSYQNDLNFVTCFLCEQGKFTDNFGSTICSECPDGYTSDQSHGVGPSSCQACEPGFYGSKQGNIKVCQKCAEGRMQSDEAQTFCETCDSQAVSNEDRTNCNCAAGLYAPSNISGCVNEQNEPLDLPDSQYLCCMPCPLGANCSDEGTIEATLVSEVGYWRGNDSLTFYRCVSTRQCIGGDECSPFREGPLCAFCEAGYASSDGIEDCTVCPTNVTTSWVVTAFVIFLALAVVAGAYKLVLEMDRQALATIKNTDDALLIQLVSKEKDRLRLKREGAEEKGERFQISGERFLPGHQSNVNAVIQEINEKRRRALVDLFQAQFGQINAGHTYKTKILLSFMQVTTNLNSAIDIPWPRLYNKFLTAFDFVNFNFLPWNSLSCIESFDYYAQMKVYTLGPLFVFGGLLFFYTLPLKIKARLKHKNTSLMFGDLIADVRELLNDARIRQRTWKIIMLTAFLIYPSVCSMITSFFMCRDIEGVSYLKADLKIVCHDEDWQSHLPFVVTMIIIYPIGVPALMAYKIFRIRNHLDAPNNKLELGFLYEAYGPGMYWFELVEMLYKLAMTSAVGFFPDQMQVPFAMFILMIYICLALFKTAFNRASDDLLQIFCITEVYLLLSAGFLIMLADSVNGLDDLTDTVLSVFLIICSCLVMLVVLIFVLNSLLKGFKKKSEAEGADVALWKLSLLEYLGKPSEYVSEYLDNLDSRGRSLHYNFKREFVGAEELSNLKGVMSKLEQAHATKEENKAKEGPRPSTFQTLYSIDAHKRRNELDFTGEGVQNIQTAYDRKALGYLDETPRFQPHFTDDDSIMASLSFSSGNTSLF
jgi:hypothetical protein